MKRCSKCGSKKNLISFYKRKTGKRAHQYYEKCKECMRLRGRVYYHQNRDKQLSLALKRTFKARLIKRDYLNRVKNKPCADCGAIYPHYVMDFDHRERGDKIVNVAHAVTRNWSLRRIREEVEKCDVVCANCHRIRTYKHLLR